MSLMTHEIEYRRLRAPQEDGGTLVDPPRAVVGDLVQRNEAVLDRFGAQAAETRQSLVAAALNYTRQYRDCDTAVAESPVFIAGHQPQLFHPGVWYKNFVLGELAREYGGVAVNLVIDSDAMRSAAIRVPTGTVTNPRLETIPFDQAGGETPYEEHAILDRPFFESFGARVCEAIENISPNAMIREFWPKAIERSRHQNNLGLAISQARHVVEGEWGSTTLELPQSRLCELPGFRRFAIQLLNDAARLRSVYNEAAAEYRSVNHIRSKAHPVPDLATYDGWTETPFWIWTVDQPRRRRLFAQCVGGEVRLTDRESLDLSLSRSPEAAVDQLEAFERRGIKVRTRALITTMFARLMLGDLFIHGIGGAKYDQVTDAIIRRFFEMEPPAYSTVTATLRLPVSRPGVSDVDLRVVDSRLRELEFHPERWIDGRNASVQEKIAEKDRWVATQQTRENARQRCQKIRHVNQSLQPDVAWLREKLLVEQNSLRDALKIEKLLASREFAFCLYPVEQLRRLMQTV
jgi:hypothetical protein